MKIEIMLYAYLAICFSMIIFNIVCIFVFNRNDKLLDDKSKKYFKIIECQINKVKNGEKIDDKHIFRIKHKMKRTSNFLALDNALNSFADDNLKYVDEYLGQILPAIIYLSSYYKKASPVKSAYFPYFITQHSILKKHKSSAITNDMISYLSKQNFYCRENALLAIFSSDDLQSILKALHIIDASENYHNTKLVSEGLLKHCTNCEEICKQLISSINSFSVNMQISIINLCRLYSGDFKEEILKLLQDASTDDEVKFACIRYFLTHPYKNAYETLLKFNDEESASRWEFTAISSISLGNYPGEKTVNSLKKNLSSANWYIRLNSAQSLSKLGLDYTSLIDIMDGEDRYAREILEYQLDDRRRKSTERSAQ